MNNLAVTNTNLNEYKNYIFTIFDSRTFSKFINYASYFVTKGEKISDQKRDRKLTLLLKYKRKKYDRIEIINYTTVKLPRKISEILQYGLNHAVGGTPNKMLIATKLEQAYTHWEKYAVDNNVEFF